MKLYRVAQTKEREGGSQPAYYFLKFDGTIYRLSFNVNLLIKMKIEATVHVSYRQIYFFIPHLTYICLKMTLTIIYISKVNDIRIASVED